MFALNLHPQGRGKERRRMNVVTFGLIIPVFSCCCGDILSKPLFPLRDCVSYFQSLLVYLPERREYSTAFFSIFATLLRARCIS